jgi:hypothetical protein
LGIIRCGGNDFTKKNMEQTDKKIIDFFGKYGTALKDFDNINKFFKIPEHE